MINYYNVFAELVLRSDALEMCFEFTTVSVTTVFNILKDKAGNYKKNIN